MIKKGLKVKILTGKDKDKEGDVMEIDRKNNRAKIKGINIIKKHVKTTNLLMMNRIGLPMKKIWKWMIFAN